MNEKHFFAVDLGATSGRTILGTYTCPGLQTEEINRFPNHLIQCNGHFYWDIYELYRNIVEGLSIVGQRKDIHLTSIGIDTWGVDYCLIDKDGKLLPDEDRLNAYGKMLRSTSLDELPELVNILIGDMAIIGPRPLLVRYLPRYNEEQHHQGSRPTVHALHQLLRKIAEIAEDRAEHHTYKQRRESDLDFSEPEGQL